MREKEWVSQARARALSGSDFSLLATGWRARRLRDQLPRLANAAAALGTGKRFNYKEGNFSVLTMWLLPGFHQVFFMALAQEFYVSWTDVPGGLSVHFTKVAPDSDHVASSH